MTGWLITAAIAVVLFVASLVGGLAATGRLNHEGTANIPLLRSLFPAPPDVDAAAAEPDAAAPDAGGATAASAANAANGEAHDALATPAGETRPADANHAQEPTSDGGPRRRKTGRSLLADGEAPAGAGDGHGAAPADHGGAGGEPAAAAPAPAGDAGAVPRAVGNANGSPQHGTPAADFQRLQQSLAHGNSQYRPGELFRFEGLPAGLTPDQINDAWQRVQALTTEIERRKVALDLQEQQLRELNEDVSRRQAALGKERVEIEQMHRDLDAKIEKFKDQVKLVRNDEVAALKRNAQTLASFEPSKAAELLEAQWKTEKGQDEVLKLLEFMDKDAVNAVLDALPKELTNDLLKKRLRVSKEATAPAKGG